MSRYLVKTYNHDPIVVEGETIRDKRSACEEACRKLGLIFDPKDPFLTIVFAMRLKGDHNEN